MGILAILIAAVSVVVVTEDVSPQTRALCEDMATGTSDLGRDPLDPLLNIEIDKLVAGEIGTLKFELSSVPATLCTGDAFGTFPGAVCGKKGWKAYGTYLETNPKRIVWECWDLAAMDSKVRIRMDCP